MEAAVTTARFSTLELFFDLVFVLTITQLTDVLYHAPTLRSLLATMPLGATIALDHVTHA